MILVYRFLQIVESLLFEAVMGESILGCRNSLPVESRVWLIVGVSLVLDFGDYYS